MSSITNLSFSVPEDVARPSDYADLGSLLLSTFSTPAHLIPSSPIRLQDIEFEEQPLESSNLGDDSDEEERSQRNEDSQRESLENDSRLSSARVRRREGARAAQLVQKQASSPKQRREAEEESEEEAEVRGVHKVKRLEILGDKVKKLDASTGVEQTSEFFFRLFKEACANIEEIIIDGILKRGQIHDMVRGLFYLI
jgi:hypothetical protein